MNTKFEQKTILVTGGAGFVGSHLCKKYLEEGHRVICLDNLQTTRTPHNIKDLFSTPRFLFVKHDIIEPLWLEENIDWIFNLACSGSYTSYQFDPVHTIKINTIGMMNMLNLARKHKARILHTSTSEIYGDPLEVPQKETYTGNVNPLGPRACYDEGKRVAETLCMDYHRQYGVDVKIVRIFNTYGPNMALNDGRVMTNFIARALDGKDLVVYGDGSNTRSFQYIDDLVRGIDRMMRKSDFIGPVNLGNPRLEINMKELAELIVRKAGSRSRIVFRDKATDDPRRRCPDITLAKEVLGWEPEVSLEEGASKTIEYYKKVPRPEKKILVFAATYYPDLGPAERALYALSEALPETEFHIVTTRFRKGVSSYEKHKTDHIYRIGFGFAFDKYLLPFLGVIRAWRLHREHEYRFVWSIMGSYGGLSAFFLKLFVKDINFLLTLDPAELNERESGFLRIPFYRLVFKKSDSIYASNASQERKVKQLAPVSYSTTAENNTRDFINQVYATYADLINKEEHKLARPR